MSSVSPAPNIILITVDCLRADHLGCYGYSRNTSPNINKLARNGVTFVNAITNGGNTPSAFPSILASALPPIYAHEHKDIIKNNTTVAEVFRSKGYSTAAFGSNPHLGGLRHYDKGFDFFYEGSWGHPSRLTNLRKTISDRIISRITSKFVLGMVSKLAIWFDAISFTFKNKPIATAEDITSQAMEWIARQQGSFFIWMHYMDVHAPYIPPQKYVKEFHKKKMNRLQMISLVQRSDKDMEKISASGIQTFIDLYDASVKHVDEFIGRLVNALGDRSENTIITITADHGDELGEHGKTLFGHITLYDAVLRVPLILAGAGIGKGVTFDQQVQSLDLAPTLVNLAGITIPPTFYGMSLVRLIRGEDMAVEKGIISVFSPVDFFICGASADRIIYSYRTSAWKYILTETTSESGITRVEELYHLETDPVETENLADVEKGEVLKFKLEALQAINRFKDQKRAELTSSEVARIRSRVKHLELNS
jgi:arylsulfatase A-like enzyme